MTRTPRPAVRSMTETMVSARFSISSSGVGGAAEDGGAGDPGEDGAEDDEDDEEDGDDDEDVGAGAGHPVFEFLPVGHWGLG